MPEKIKEFLKQFTSAQLYLISANAVLVFFLIALFNLGVLPMKNYGDFIFFAVLGFAFALYRPGWSFLFLIGTIGIENINLAPVTLGISIRPYQFFAGLIMLAVINRLLAKRLSFKLEKLRRYDLVLICVALAGFLSSLGSADKISSLKLSVIFLSFVALYLLVRNFIRDMEDLKKIIPFFLSSSAVVVIYGIWQNVRFARGFSSYEIMPGRPNATFAEADWLGIYLVLLISVICTIVFYFDRKTMENQSSQISNFQFPIFNQFSISKFQILKTFLHLFLILIYALLIITVSRSAWLGVLAATLLFLLMILSDFKINPKFWHWKIFFVTSIRIAASLILALAAIYFFHLTNFQLFNRAESTGSGLQKITVACAPDQAAPEIIGSIEELDKFGCRHINLEDIEKEITNGNAVSEIYRRDPNTSIRKATYQKVWQEIKNHPIGGIGWGSIEKVLGKDEGGAGLNASNIFLEIWLGTGIIGLLAFSMVWFYIPIRAAVGFFRAVDLEEKAFATFAIPAWIGLTIANLFNAGIMLGFLWVFLAISLIELQTTRLEKI